MRKIIPLVALIISSSILLIYPTQTKAALPLASTYSGGDDLIRLSKGISVGNCADNDFECFKKWGNKIKRDEFCAKNNYQIGYCKEHYLYHYANDDERIAYYYSQIRNYCTTRLKYIEEALDSINIKEEVSKRKLFSKFSYAMTDLEGALEKKYTALRNSASIEERINLSDEIVTLEEKLSKVKEIFKKKDWYQNPFFDNRGLLFDEYRNELMKETKQEKQRVIDLMRKIANIDHNVQCQEGYTYDTCSMSCVKELQRTQISISSVSDECQRITAPSVNVAREDVVRDLHYRINNAGKVIYTDKPQILPIGYMIKAHSDPKSYIVMEDGMLRWVINEDVAERMFGNNWDDRIIWLEESLVYTYKIGEPINN